MPFILSLLLLVCGALLAVFAASALFFRDEINAARSKDPAARSLLEIVILYQGLHALLCYRVARVFFRLKLYLAARLVSQFGRQWTGIEIHPGAVIGRGLFIDHGMGVVIGETAVVGNNVLLYQGVTLGGTGIRKGKRHPTVGDNVVIGAGAKVLGDIKIGDNSYIGANAVVIKDVPPNSTEVGVPGRITRQDGKKIDVSLDHIHILDPLVESIEALQKRIEQLEKDRKTN